MASSVLDPVKRRRINASAKPSTSPYAWRPGQSSLDDAYAAGSLTPNAATPVRRALAPASMPAPAPMPGANTATTNSSALSPVGRLTSMTGLGPKAGAKLDTLQVGALTRADKARKVEARATQSDDVNRKALLAKSAFLRPGEKSRTVDDAGRTVGISNKYGKGSSALKPIAKTPVAPVAKAASPTATTPQATALSPSTLPVPNAPDRTMTPVPVGGGSQYRLDSKVPGQTDTPMAPEPDAMPEMPKVPPKAGEPGWLDLGSKTLATAPGKFMTPDPAPDAPDAADKAIKDLQDMRATVGKPKALAPAKPSPTITIPSRAQEAAGNLGNKVSIAANRTAGTIANAADTLARAAPSALPPAVKVASNAVKTAAAVTSAALAPRTIPNPAYDEEQRKKRMASSY